MGTQWFSVQERRRHSNLFQVQEDSSGGQPRGECIKAGGSQKHQETVVRVLRQALQDIKTDAVERGCGVIKKGME